MVNSKYIGNNGLYTTTREVGKGGEGTVYELSGVPDKVVKIYTEAPDLIKVCKLEWMASFTNAKVKEYAAWPLDTVKDSSGKTVGFVMKKLTNYVPLHMLFSPMDRKKLFPEKGYNFLVHVAKNLATAFYTLHAAGLIIGDVNEGNILVNKQGMIAFIDCDSFQVQDGSTYYYCEVGVPRYTPPELLEKDSFQQVIRTENTDSFSLAILIFQLLFLGRHPFAGRNISNEDIDEETAIRQHLFAFSTKNNKKKLLPPLNSFDIHYLPATLTGLFHLAFEKREDRPLPVSWVTELNTLLQHMTTCSKTSLHVYPSGIDHCPWCEFREQKNILYFLDDALLQSFAALNDIETFIQGFRIEKLRFAPVDLESLPVVQVQPKPIDKQFLHYRWYQRVAICLLVVVIATVLFLIRPASVFLAGFIFRFTSKLFPWKNKIEEELYRRSLDQETKLSALEAAIDEYNYLPEVEKYNEIANNIEQLIHQYKALPTEIQAKRKEAEERLYNEQLTHFLQFFAIEDCTITNIGTARKQSLYAAGIITAADIAKLNSIKVQGIGPKYIQTLFSWQRQMSTQFVYHPNDALLNSEYERLQAAVTVKKKRLEDEIRKTYQTLQYVKTNFPHKQVQLKNNIQFLHAQYRQAAADYEAFKNV